MIWIYYILSLRTSLSVVTLWLTFNMVARSDINLEKFRDSGGERCVSSEYHHRVTVRSLLECGVHRAKHRFGSCTIMTYIKANNTCQILAKNLNSSYYVPGCSSYRNKRIKASNCSTTGLNVVNYTECSIPFTYKGKLYSDCAQLNPDNSCDIRYCPLFDGGIVVCNPHNDVVGITIVKNITVGNRVLPAPVINNWIIIQQRIDGNISFYQNWETYKQGFGNPSSNFWFGLETLQPLMTSQLALRLEIFANDVWYSDMYSTFNLKNEAQGYRIHVNGYYGDSGDVIKSAQTQDLVIFNSQFSTFDKDNDNLKSGSCAVDSGWWFRKCSSFNLNAPYDDPSQFRYYLVKYDSYVPITTCRMMVKLV